MTEGFTAKEIVSIIVACHKSRVKKLTWGEFSLDFSLEDQDELLGSPSITSDHPARDIHEVLKEEDPFVEELEKQTLLMEDPAEYERVIMHEMMEAEAKDGLLAERTQQDVSRGRYSP